VNHKLRAKSLVGRGIPPRIIVRDGPRTLRVDVTDFQRNIAKEVARGLRRAEREAYRHGLSDAANEVGRLLQRPREIQGSPGDAECALKTAIDRILDVYKRGVR